MMVVGYMLKRRELPEWVLRRAVILNGFLHCYPVDVEGKKESLNDKVSHLDDIDIDIAK